MVFFAVMPPEIFEVIDFEMRITFGKLVRWASNITAVAELLSHHWIDLKRRPLIKNQVRCL